MTASQNPSTNSSQPSRLPLIVMSIATIGAIVATVGAVFEIDVIAEFTPLGLVVVTLIVTLIAYVAWRRKQRVTQGGPALVAAIGFVSAAYVCLFTFCGVGMTLGSGNEDRFYRFGTIGGAVGLVVCGLLLLWMQRWQKP